VYGGAAHSCSLRSAPSGPADAGCPPSCLTSATSDIGRQLTNLLTIFTITIDSLIVRPQVLDLYMIQPSLGNKLIVLKKLLYKNRPTKKLYYGIDSKSRLTLERSTRKRNTENYTIISDILWPQTTFNHREELNG
jgi:hypothetical protein